ncbi:pilus assembly protein [Thalassobacter stenotrophicus]|uniref:pilus assembly protein n=1 Tax=Thalassobacter stenotrophicus TaxID=266809 RepID=UPI00056DC4C8|nr:pilus assembly protein [Thalassobacter stenotrophicus]
MSLRARGMEGIAVKTKETDQNTTSNAPRRGLRHALRRFKRSERGSMVIFGLMIMILMLVAGGIAVDTMRYEANRTKLQNTLDRAVLAAASLDQDLDPTLVVTDYFAKAGLQGYTLDVDVEQDTVGSYRKVTAEASIDVNSLFLHMVGIDSINAPATGTAEERVLNVEISLVLDISGSMGNWSPTGGKSKMQLMKDAATEFVNTVLVDEQKDLVSVSVIPYNGKVNAGTLVANHFNFTNEHNFSNCINFSEAMFSTTTIDPLSPLPRMGHFNKDSTSGSMTNPWCPTNEYGAIIPWSNNKTTINAAINGLNADGWTAIDVGMKWASILIDPSTQANLSAMAVAAPASVDPIFAGRPVAYNDRDTIKVVILMTDGSNTNQYDLKNEFKSGLSNVWIYERSGRAPQFSYYIPENNRYRDPWDNTNYSTPIGGSAARQMSYVELWSRYNVRWVADNIYPTRNGASSPYNWKNRIRNAVAQHGGQTVGDRRLAAICSETKAQANRNLVIFSIAFEAPPSGEAALRDCASTPSHYYDVNGFEINEVFAAIAQTIGQLRLTQ